MISESEGGNEKREKEEAAQHISPLPRTLSASFGLISATCDPAIIILNEKRAGGGGAFQRIRTQLCDGLGRPSPHPPSSCCPSLEGFHLYFLTSDSSFPVLPQEGPTTPAAAAAATTPGMRRVSHTCQLGLRAGQLNADPVSPRLNATNEPFPSAAKCQSHQSHPSRGGGGESSSRDTF